MRIRLVCLSLLLVACDPTDPADCLSLRDAVARENCLFKELSALYPDQPDAFRAGLQALDSAASRDLIRLRLAIADPSRSAELCREVETHDAEEKCRQVLGRPHLRARPGPPRPPPARGSEEGEAAPLASDGEP